VLGEVPAPEARRVRDLGDLQLVLEDLRGCGGGGLDPVEHTELEAGLGEVGLGHGAGAMVRRRR
jgi:hypothetical protein